MNMPDADFLFEFRKFLDQHVDCRLEAMLTEDNRTANHEDRTAELESKIEELESQIEYDTVPKTDSPRTHTLKALHHTNTMYQQTQLAYPCLSSLSAIMDNKATAFSKVT